MLDGDLSIRDILKVCVENTKLPDFVRGACSDAMYRIEELERELTWIAEQYDDAIPGHDLAMRLYDVRCTALRLLQDAPQRRGL